MPIHVQAIGTVAYGPDLKETSRNTTLVTVTVKVPRLNPKEGSAGFDLLRVSIWGDGGKAAMNLAQGDSVLVAGELENRAYKPADSDKYRDSWQVSVRALPLERENERRQAEQPPSYRPGSRSPSYDDAHDEIPF